VTAEEEARYTKIIDGILAAADLQTVTRKRIRQGLEAAVGKDLSDQKVCCCLIISFQHNPADFCVKSAIKSLIEARFDAISSDTPQAIPTPPSGHTIEQSPSHNANGRAPSNDAEPDVGADGEIEVWLQPAKKKQKRESSSEDADARLAAELQAQENRLSRGPRTRGGVAGKAAKPKLKKSKVAKKKSDKRARSDDESDAEGDSDSGKPKRKAGGGFQKPFNLSYPLQELCGETQVRCPFW